MNTVVLDIGARYGIHPTWQDWPRPLRYVMFEADADEAKRLARQYRGHAGVSVEAMAAHDHDGSVTLHMAKHRGLSSLYRPNVAAAWFRGGNASKATITEVRHVPAVTLDGYCIANGIAPDFLKCDTEGNEAAVLRGASHILSTFVIGARIEVQFDEAYHGIELFPAVNDLMLEYGFRLVGFDRESPVGGCDAIYLKNKLDPRQSALAADFLARQAIVKLEAAE